MNRDTQGTRTRVPVKVMIGGVMRCCLDRDYWPEDPSPGDLLDCPHGCGSRLVWWNGAWEWYRPTHPARTNPEPPEPGS